MKSRMSRSLIAISLAALASLSWAPRADAALPEVQRIGGVEVLSGGIGHDEAQAVQAEARRWPLTLEVAVSDQQHSDYAANVLVHVRDTRGHTVLETTSEGPFLLARLAPGAYRIDASLGGHTLHRDVKLQPGHPASVLFLWPRDADAAAL